MLDAYMESFLSEPFFPYVAAGCAVILVLLIVLIVSISLLLTTVFPM